MYTTHVDVTERRENNADSTWHMKFNRDLLNNQCKIVLEILERGERLTTRSAMINYNIGDLRRRVKDLKDFWNVPVLDERINGNIKEYYL